MRLYTPVATISVEHSLFGGNETSYRFSTELGMNNSMIAMRKFLNELHFPNLVKIREIKKDPYENIRCSLSDVLLVQNLQILIRKDELETIESFSDKHFVCIVDGFPKSRDELAQILIQNFGIK